MPASRIGSLRSRKPARSRHPRRRTAGRGQAPAQGKLIERKYLLGDPWGSRDYLLGKGVSFDLRYVNDYFGVVGGSTTEGRNKDFGRIRLTIGVDLEKLAGIPGLTFRVSAVNQAGPDIANTVGTFTNPSSIAGVKTTRRHQDPL